MEKLEPLEWPLYIYYLMSIISLPVYFMVLICLVRLRSKSKTYNSPFYTILLQHGIADILTMVFFLNTQIARVIAPLGDLYYKYQQYYIAAATYNSIYVFLYIRCWGIVFLSFQRYFVITSPTWIFTLIIQSAKHWQIIGVYWMVPLLISGVVLKDTNFHYQHRGTLLIVTDKEIIERNTLMALVIVSITCIICSLCYGSLFYFLRVNASGLSRNIRREVNLAFQVFILLFAFFAILAFYAFQNYFSRAHNTGPIFYMRSIYPVATGFLSYLNPFCIIFMNREFSSHIRKTFACHKYFAVRDSNFV